MDKQTHKEILIKFSSLKGSILTGRKEIKGINKDQRVLPDEYVSKEHILHDLIRGFYKPAKKDYLLSYLATESKENYGKQIKWIDENRYDFKEIRMFPPDGEKDNRKKSDIAAARYSMAHKIPLGIIHRMEKGKYRVLGLGIIEEEDSNGVFLVKPLDYYNGDFNNNSDSDTKIAEELITTGVREQEYRIGQNTFKEKLVGINSHCELCDVSSDFTIASHIKPWKRSNPVERLDIYNGFLLCPNHDCLFDSGFITFNSDGKILISSILKASDIQAFELDPNLSVKVSPEKEFYLEYHRAHIYKN